MTNDWFEDYIKRQKEREEFKKSIAYSTEYIDWLDSFTKEHGSFSTDSFLYEPEKITDEERKKVDLIEALYELTDEYADENYIMPTKTDYGAFYSIKHNGVGYFIGFDAGQGTSFYCTRLEEPEEDALEYKHLMSGVKLPSTIIIDQKLEELSELIERLDREQVPLEAINQKTDATIQKIRTKKI